MRPLFSWILLAVSSLAVVPGPAGAQVAPIMYEVRAGVGFPVQEFASRDARPMDPGGSGFSFGMNFAYSFAWYGVGYLGFSQHRFGCPASGCGRRTDLVSTGFDGGIRWVLGTGGVVPWIRTGLLSYRAEGSAAGPGDTVEETTSERAYGAEAGLGLTIQVRPDVVVSPGVRYGRISPRFEEIGEVPMRYLTADLGIVLGF